MLDAAGVLAGCASLLPRLQPIKVRVGIVRELWQRPAHFGHRQLFITAMRGSREERPV